MTAVTPGAAAAATMTAIVQDEYGTAPEAVLRLAEIARPTIAADEILVRVRAASVDRGTWHLMAGLPYPMRLAGFGLRRPKAPNPGRSLAGTVESAGQRVTGFKPGDEVYGTCDGSFAPYRPRPGGRLAPKPANLSFEQAAAVPVSALTALQAVRDQAQVQPGQKVLIIGASGGVGTFAVQIAKAFGAEVTGVCSTAKTTWSAPSAPTTSSTTPARISRQAAPLRRDPRHRRHQQALTSAPGPHPPAAGSSWSAASPAGGGSAGWTACSMPTCSSRW